MKILFLTEQFPFPLHDGGNLRTYHVLKGLGQVHDVTLVSHQATEDPEAAIASVSDFCNVVTVAEPSVPRRVVENTLRSGFRLPLFVIKNWSSAILRAADQLCQQNEFDAIHLNMLDTACFATARDWREPLVFDSHNCLAQIADGVVRQSRNPFKRLLFRRETKALKRFESAVADRVDLTLVCSENDARLFSDLASKATCLVAPNGVDCGYFQSTNDSANGEGVKEDPSRLVFTGSMSYFPNEEGALWFVEKVLPLLAKAAPEVGIDVVGRTPPSSLQAIHDGKRVNVTGTVPDVRPYVEQASVFVVPLQTGGGTRLKILEAFSMGKAVVSTSKGAEGIDAVDGEEILIADDPSDFADAIQALLASPEKRSGLGAAAKRLAERKYDWSGVQRLVLDGYQELVKC